MEPRFAHQAYGMPTILPSFVSISTVSTPPDGKRSVRYFAVTFASGSTNQRRHGVFTAWSICSNANTIGPRSNAT